MHAALKLARYLRPYWRWVLIAPMLMALEVAMDLLQPRMVERIVDEGIARLDLNLVLGTGLLMFGLAVIGALGGMSNGCFAEKTVQAFGADLRETLFRKVQTFSFGDLEVLETGQLITRLTNDVTQVQEALLMVLRLVVGAITPDRQPDHGRDHVAAAGLSAACADADRAGRRRLDRRDRATPLYTRVQQRLDALNQVMQESLAGVRVVKAFVRAPHEEARFGVANAGMLDERFGQRQRVVAVMPAFMMFTLNVSIIGVLWFGGVQVTQGGMQFGQVIAFINYLTTTLFSLIMVSQLVIQLARAEASARRILEVLERRPGVQNRPNAVTHSRRSGGWRSRTSPSISMTATVTRCSRASASRPSPVRPWP